MIINPYLNFDGNAEEAFRFYQSVFGGELYVQKMKDVPGAENLTEEEKDYVMHVALPIGNGQFLMASDCLSSRGQILQKGNHNYISVAPDSREEAERLFNGLSEGGKIERYVLGRLFRIFCGPVWRVLDDQLQLRSRAE